MPILQGSGELYIPYSVTLVRESVQGHPPVGDEKPAEGGMLSALPVLMALATATATVAALTSRLVVAVTPTTQYGAWQETHTLWNGTDTKLLP